MEHIGKSLGRFHNPANIPALTNLGIEGKPTPEDDKESKLSRFNLSSLEHTFKTFERMKGTETAYDTFYKLGMGESPKKFVLCYGGAGCGKTHLIEATIIAWAKRGIATRYQTMSQLMRLLKKSMRSNQTPSYDGIFESICGRTHLIIDDVGMGTIDSRWEIAELEDIINERYHRRHYDDGKVTILASNKDIIDLPDRIVSRFYDPEFGAVVFIEAGDYRRRKV